MLISTWYLPSGADWAGVTTKLYDGGDDLVKQYVGVRDDRQFSCVGVDAGCFTAEFTFADPSTSGELSYIVATTTEEVTTSFTGELASESYFFCVEGGRLARTPTSAPTISALPTPAPSSLPSATPSSAPSSTPTPAPTPAPTVDPTPAPTPEPSADRRLFPSIEGELLRRRPEASRPGEFRGPR